MTMTSSRPRPEGPARAYHGSASSVEDLSLTRNESPCLGLDPFSFRKSRVDLQVEAWWTADSLAQPRSDHLFYFVSGGILRGISSLFPANLGI